MINLINTDSSWKSQFFRAGYSYSSPPSLLFYFEHIFAILLASFGLVFTNQNIIIAPHHGQIRLSTHLLDVILQVCGSAETIISSPLMSLVLNHYILDLPQKLFSSFFDFLKHFCFLAMSQKIF